MTDRLLFITQYFAPAWGYGGPPIVLYRLTRELVNLGFSITVITTDSLDGRRQKSGKEIIDGVKVFRFPTVSNCLAYKLKRSLTSCGYLILSHQPNSDFARRNMKGKCTGSFQLPKKIPNYCSCRLTVTLGRRPEIKKTSGKGSVSQRLIFCFYTLAG